jgi:hypothetical protein
MRRIWSVMTLTGEPPFAALPFREEHGSGQGAFDLGQYQPIRDRESVRVDLAPTSHDQVSLPRSMSERVSFGQASDHSPGTGDSFALLSAQDQWSLISEPPLHFLIRPSTHDHPLPSAHLAKVGHLIRQHPGETAMACADHPILRHSRYHD